MRTTTLGTNSHIASPPSAFFTDMVASLTQAGAQQTVRVCGYARLHA
ncbi:MAG: hypothetical protein OEV99_12460 [Nitrospira sp.]|nr:hypothetical protein [Nitrospira sp.]MDH4370642.1 hypothetical protein [Nitrospira sp.]MDH5347554.1 hypothetical protein [Nitrospira sp.]MDH5496974.1 hypothetical protein [Nitrospira sp.]MDH5726075.1 hypothetical protein [Nitrospira sp.]